MNYETATDFDLNLALAGILFDKKTIGTSYNLQSKTNRVRINCSARNFGNYFDPCNNWRDIMPIAVELGEVTVSRVCAEILIDGYMYKKASYCDRGGNGQRALVICCIKVLEKDNV